MSEAEQASTGQSRPELSAVIVTPDDYQTIRETIRCLAAQEVSDRIELVIVAPSADGLGLENGGLGFFRIEVVEAGEVRSSAAARVAGIRRSSSLDRCRQRESTTGESSEAPSRVKARPRLIDRARRAPADASRACGSS